MSIYTLIPDDQATCPTCHKSVYLLCVSDWRAAKGMPAFYICFRCETIGQVGVGQVKKLTLEDE